MLWLFCLYHNIIQNKSSFKNQENCCKNVVHNFIVKKTNYAAVLYANNYNFAPETNLKAALARLTVKEHWHDKKKYIYTC